MARVKVVLRQEIPNLGGAGDIVVVAGGFARNYLIPRGMAVPATKGAVRDAEALKERVASKLSRELGSAEELRAKLEGAPLEVRAQAGPEGRLFGSITNADIAGAIHERYGIEIDRHVIHLAEPIRSVGFHEATVRLHPEVVAQLTVEAVQA
jgi:large subunit ribosomal protein L9